MIAAPLAAMALNAAVTQATIRQTICVSGWSAQVRPPSSYTRAIKRRQVPRTQRLSAYELDHWIPISLGGDPYDPRNLVLQPIAEAHRKDRLETALHKAVCRGSVTLRGAQLRMEAWRP